jgi:5-methylcytosine-specific restriction endonuclease McrA
VPRKLPASVQEQVRQRANFLCEYCHTDETWQYIPFTIDHVIPVSEGGEDNLENLALACFHCNRYKSNQQMAFDRVTEQLVPLFNPRKHRWSDHFIWSGNGLLIIPLTAIGRATIELLEFNRERALPGRDSHPARRCQASLGALTIA